MVEKLFPGEVKIVISEYLDNNSHPTFGNLIVEELRYIELGNIDPEEPKKEHYIVDVVPSSADRIKRDITAKLTIDEENWFAGLDRCCERGFPDKFVIRVRLADVCYNFPRKD